jgi:hypothetical protein
VFDDAGGGQYATTRIALPAEWGSLAITGVGAADVDGDGDDDVAIGAPSRNYSGGRGIGSALLVISGSAAPPNVLLLDAPAGGDEFGWRVGIVDGFALAAAPGHPAGTTQGAGQVFLLPVVDNDTDGWLDADDNCPVDANPTQVNNDRDAVDLSPPKAFDDLTWPNSDAAGDACDPDDDNDGIDDAREAALPDAQCPTASGPTGPLARDTDDDLVLDGAECLLGADPGSAASFPPAMPLGDGDRDGLPDTIEAGIGSNPTLADTDSDGITDGVEVRGYGSSPTAVDTDGDGCGDGREIASINGDRAVTSIDLSQVAQAFGAMGSATYFAHFDINRDRKISSIDLSTVARRFGAC